MKLRALPQLDARLTSQSPLSHLLHARQDGSEFSRRRAHASRYAPFHIKYSTVTEVEGRRLTILGQPLLNFASANYLGLDQHPEVLYAAKRAIDELGNQGGCQREVSSPRNLLELEANLARLLSAEAAVVGQSTAQIHAGALAALFGDEDSALFIESHAQPALREAALLAQAKGARLVNFDAQDIPGLRKILAREKFRRGALIVDGIFDLEGPSPDLRALGEAAAQNGLVLYVDDSHGVGVLGKKGGGAKEIYGLSFDNLLVVSSLEHALGSFGGFLAAKAPVIDFLRVMSSSFSGNLQPASVEGALAAVRIASSEEGHRLRAQLAVNSARMRRQLQGLGFKVPHGVSPVLPICMGRELKTLMAARKLFDLGVLGESVLPPLVPRKRAMIRISLTTLHGEDELERLALAFTDLREFLLKHENPLRQVAHLAFALGKSKWLGGSLRNRIAF